MPLLSCSSVSCWLGPMLRFAPPKYICPRVEALSVFVNVVVPDEPKNRTRRPGVTASLQSSDVHVAVPDNRKTLLLLSSVIVVADVIVGIGAFPSVIDFIAAIRPIAPP